MQAGIIIFFSILFGSVCVWLILKAFVLFINKRAESVLLKKFGKRDIILASKVANFFGKRSKGGLQIRGNGILVLTKQGLLFTLAFPEKEYKIPIESITAVTLPKTFAGKTIFMPLLCVEFVVDGKEEAMAWAVKSPKEWKKAIEALVHQHASDNSRTSVASEEKEDKITDRSGDTVDGQTDKKSNDKADDLGNYKGKDKGNDKI